jgi:hypothetical protein
MALESALHLIRWKKFLAATQKWGDRWQRSRSGKMVPIWSREMM